MTTATKTQAIANATESSSIPTPAAQGILERERENRILFADLSSFLHKVENEPALRLQSREKKSRWEAIGEIKAVAEGSKVHSLLCTLLEGQSTIDEINAKHPRNKTQHTFITYDVIRLGYSVEIDSDGHYQLILPEGCNAIATK